MGYSSSRDNELKLVEEKKEDDCGTRDELEDREDRDERKRPPVAATASEGNANPEGEEEEEDSSDEDDDDDDVGADANENSDMLLHDPNEQQQLQQQFQQQLQHQDGQQHALNFASSNAGMQSHHLQSALAAQQQLLEHAVVAQHLQQTRLMTSSLSSLQLGAALQPAVLPLPAFAGSMALNPVAPNAAAVQYQIQQQQQVLAQQQAAAQAAALSIGAVTSSRALAAGGLGVPLGGQPTPPLGVPFAPGAPAMQPAAVMSPLAPLAPLGMNPVASAPLLGATGPLGAITAATNPAAGLVPVAPAIAPAAPMTSGHHLAPQLTIPHYVPPIPPTWGAQVPALSVQDRPLVPPIYNGINPNYPGAQLLHAHPPIFAVENFLSPAECDFLIENANDAFGPAPVVGRGSGEVSPSRTSSTCYLAREDLPEYLRKVGLLTGKPAEHCELPQVGRYMPSQQYLQHFDAFDLSNDDGRRFAANGGQRTVTVLVYLNDVARGGSTAFPNLNLEVRPRRGMALVFFPSTLDGLLDRMALHAALPAVDVKYVSQVWIRQSNYEGRPSKRLAEPMLGGLQERREAQERAMMMGQAMQQQRLSAQHLHVQAQQMHQQQQMLQGQPQGREGYEQMNG